MSGEFGYFRWSDTPETGITEVTPRQVRHYDAVRYTLPKFFTTELDNFKFGTAIYDDAVVNDNSTDVGIYAHVYPHSLGTVANRELNNRTYDIRCTCDGTPVGSGFGMQTQMDSYSVTITMEDSRGTHSQKFDYDPKINPEEFYEFNYDGLKWFTLKFDNLPYGQEEGKWNGSLIKVTGVTIGRVFIIDESILVDKPTITTHFDVKGGIEADTLELRLLNVEGNESQPDEHNLRPRIGQNVYYDSRINFYLNGSDFENRNFYITDVKNNGNFIELFCQDAVSTLDKEVTGLFGRIIEEGDRASDLNDRITNVILKTKNATYWQTIEDLLAFILKGSPFHMVPWFTLDGQRMDDLRYSYVRKGTWYGILTKANQRDQLKKVGEQLGVALLKTTVNGKPNIYPAELMKVQHALRSYPQDFEPLKSRMTNLIAEFDESNVLPGFNVTRDEQVAKVKYQVTDYHIDTTQQVEIWHDNIGYKMSQYIEFNDPYPVEYFWDEYPTNVHLNYRTYEAILTNNGDEHTVTLKPSDVFDGEENIPGVKGDRVKITYSGAIVYGLIVKANPLWKSFYNREINIASSGKTVDLGEPEIHVANGANELDAAYDYIYRLNYKVTFQSITEIPVGTYVHLSFLKNEDFAEAYDSDGNFSPKIPYGWVTSKKNDLSGVYEYEVVFDGKRGL